MNRRHYVIFMGILPVVIALICGGLVILFTGGNPFRTYWLLARESFGNWTSIRNTLIASTALLFTSTATAIGFRAGVFTLSAEGAFISGGFAAAVAGAFTMNIAGWQGIVLLLLVGSIVGAAVSLIPAMLKAYLDVDEVVSTLMFNFVIAGLVTWLVQSFFLAPNEGNASTVFIQEKYHLPENFLGLNLSLGFGLAVLFVVLYSILIRRTRLGYDIRSLGYSKQFSKAIGVKESKTILFAMLLTGAIAGIGGAVHLSGLVHRYVSGFSAGYGFTGLAIALLAKFKPMGLIGGSLLLGAISSAGATVQLYTNIPLDIVNVLQGFIMIAAVIDGRNLIFRRKLPRRSGVNE